MHNLKIAFISHYPELYGANRSMLDLLTNLKQNAVADPFLICAREGDLVDRARSINIPVKIVPFNTWMSERVYMGRAHHRVMQHLDHRKRARNRYSSNQLLLPDLERQMKKWNCDVIYSNSSVIGIGYELSTRTGLPHIWHIREFAQHHYKLYFDQGKRSFRKALTQATQLITISKAVSKHLHSICGRNDINVIYNGVLGRSEFDQVRAACPWPEDPTFTFGMVGLIHPSKGHLEAIDAVAEISKEKDVRLLIAGSGKTEKLEQRIAALNLSDRVSFLGYVSDPFEVYKKCHAVLMCSKHEGMGRVTAEAMAAGRPVIGHASGGTVELIEDEKNGYLYGEGRRSLQAQMSVLIKDPDNAKKMGEIAAQQAKERFAIEDHVDKVCEVLARIPRHQEA